ncbi:MAG: hypothetical protein JXA43_02250 [Candidatus Diapherotrites archaeon]|nr:hypothetical protein [Candidatus Diapherotrites archaeon]
MSIKTVTDISAFEKLFPELSKEDRRGSKGWAIRKYLENRGIVKIDCTVSGDPVKLIYPDKLKLMNLIETSRNKREMIRGDLKKWKNRHSKAKNEKITLQAKKLTMSDYWKHKAKYTTDKAYRDSWNRVDMDTEIAAHDKYGAMFRMFVNNDEYRSKLVDTVENSVVYSKDKKLAKNVQVLREFKMNMSNTKIESYNKKITELNEYIKAMQTLSNWR